MPGDAPAGDAAAGDAAAGDAEAGDAAADDAAAGDAAEVDVTASGVEEDSDDEDIPELCCYMTDAEVKNLPEEQKEELRKVMAVDEKQFHFKDFQWDAAYGAEAPFSQSLQQMAKVRRRIYEQLPNVGDPIPSVYEWMDGIEHYNTDSKERGKTQNVLRALHSKKIHYYNKLRAVIENKDDTKLTLCWPDLSPASGGRWPLGFKNQQNLVQTFAFRSAASYLKHILTFHDGEVRTVGHEWWCEFPQMCNVYQACFWQYQLVNEDCAP